MNSLFTKKIRERDQLKRFLCNSPVYDPNVDHEIRDRPCLIEHENIDDTFREFKDEGVYPGLGTYHMYHRN
jgi:hypothetical protein